MTRFPRLRYWMFLAGCACVVAAAGSTGAQNRPVDPDIRKEFADSLTTVPDASSLNTRGTVYVPIYSSVRDAANKEPVEVTATLRIDNASDSKPIVINRIDYFSTAGKLVQSYLDQPLALRPFGAIQISIAAEDQRGGAASNFIVAWSGAGPIAEPVIEAVMVGTVGNSSYSFVSQGRPIRMVGRSRWFDFRTR